MRFAELIGNKLAVQNLRLMVQRDQIAQACLLLGPAGTGKKTAAGALAEALVCQNPQEGQSCGQCFSCRQAAAKIHPDIFDCGGLKLDNMRELISRALKGPEMGRYWVGLLPEADNLTPEAANALLKVLEEPGSQTVFILTAQTPQNLLPTLLSRCRQFRFSFLNPEQMQEILSRQGLVANFPLELAAGSLSQALDFIQGEGFAQRQQIINLAQRLHSSAPALELELELFGKNPERKTTIKQLNLLLDWYRDLWVWKLTNNPRLIFNQDCLEILAQEIYTESSLRQNLRQVKQIIQDLMAGANVRLALESLFFQLS